MTISERLLTSLARQHIDRHQRVVQAIAHDLDRRESGALLGMSSGCRSSRSERCPPRRCKAPSNPPSRPLPVVEDACSILADGWDTSRASKIAANLVIFRRHMLDFLSEQSDLCVSTESRRRAERLSVRTLESREGYRSDGRTPPGFATCRVWCRV